MAHSESVRVTSLAFKPSATLEDEGNQIWLGTSSGEIHEIDIINQSLIKTKNAHRREVIKLFRYASELWSLDDSGELHGWIAAQPTGRHSDHDPSVSRLRHRALDQRVVAVQQAVRP